MKHRKLFLLNGKKLVFVAILNPLFATYIYLTQHSPWAWHKASLAINRELTLVDVLALIQFVLAAFTLDQVMRKLLVGFNQTVKQGVIPAFVIQLASLFLYAMVALIAYFLLFDYPMRNILAASGMVSLGIGYFSKDLIQDVLMSIQIQADNLVSVNDWIHLDKMEAGELYKIHDIDSRMTTLVSLSGYKQVIRNSVFYNMRIINMSRQDSGCYRFVDIDVESKFSEAKVLQILEYAIKSVFDSNLNFHRLANCLISDVTPYRVTYKIEYYCAPHVKFNQSNHEVKQAALRFLRCAGYIEAGLNVTDLVSQISEKSRAITSHQVMPETDSNKARLLGIFQYNFLNVLNQTEVAQISEKINIFSVNAGQKLITAGEHGDAMYLISEGILEVPNIATLIPGDCAGEMSLLTGAPRTADVFAKTDGVVIKIKSEDLAPLLKKNPTLVDAMAHLVEIRQASVMENKESSSLGFEPQTLKQKILTFFKLLSN